MDIRVYEFLNMELAGKIAAAQWHRPDWADNIIRFMYDSKTQTDCFNVILQYRRQHITERMLILAEQTLCDKWCMTLRCYVEPDNTPSLLSKHKNAPDIQYVWRIHKSIGAEK